MSAHAEMEGVLSGGLGHVLVACNTGSFKRLGGELLLLIGHEMRRERKLVDACLLTTEIEDSDFRVRYTPAVPRFRVRLVLAISIATRGT